MMISALSSHTFEPFNTRHGLVSVGTHYRLGRFGKTQPLTIASSPQLKEMTAQLVQASHGHYPAVKALLEEGMSQFGHIKGRVKCQESLLDKVYRYAQANR